MAMMAGDELCLTGLSATILAAFTGSGLDATSGLRTLAHAIAVAVVDEIQGHAEVMPTALVAPSGGGPVTGTGTIQ